jgi:hypothetical protein
VLAMAAMTERLGLFKLADAPTLGA